MTMVTARYLKSAERIAWTAGVVLLAAYAGIRFEQHRVARADVALFERLAMADGPGEQGSPQSPTGTSAAREPEATATDFSLWTPNRVKAYLASLQTETRLPIALFEIPRLKLRAAILEGTDEAALNRGLGHIEGTPSPGEEGNVGIAGHRDGLFRCLKDVKPGDELRLTSKGKTQRYWVSEIRIVMPEEISVLDPTGQAALTLVTCYPFYYQGDAPKRFIVRAYRSPPYAAPTPGPITTRPSD